MLQRLPLSFKLLIVTIIAAIGFGFILDSYHNRQLYNLYEHELLETVKDQARIERLRFDRQVKFFMQIARVAASFPPLIQQLSKPSTTAVSKNIRRRPAWFPGRSLISTQVHPRLVLLLNQQGEIHSSYSTQIESIPSSLSPPTDYYRSNSNGQTMLSMIDEKQPWMLATAEVFDVNREVIGYVMLGAPLDSELLYSAHRYDIDPNITALVDIKGDTPRILTSSDPEIISAGQSLHQIEQSYLITGREFFDYGSSDLPLHFISLRSRERINQQLSVVLDVAAQQRYLQSAGLALVFVLAIAWLTRRMRRLSIEVGQFARKNLGVEIDSNSADSLTSLEHDIHLLEEKVVEVHKQELKREKAAKWKARQQLRISEMRLYEFFDQAEELIQSVSPDGLIRYTNQRWQEELGYTRDELSNVKITTLIAPEYLDEHFKRLDTLSYGQSVGLFHSCFISKSGEKIEVEGTAHCHFEDGELVEIHGIYRNISERLRNERAEKERQEQLEHTQRLESLGILAGGIAHDFNNLLTTILGNTTLVSRALNPDSDEFQRLDRVIDSTQRGADLCRQMLAYAGKSRFVIKPLHLPSMMQEITKLLEVSISKQVELRYELDEDVPNIKADVSQIQQVMMNLIINASEAIGDQTGCITIRTGLINADEQFLNQCLSNFAEPGEYVWIEVKDSGCGMDDETRQKVFDPFFTTKLSGRGLGMSAILGIIKAHQGALRLKSKKGKGSSFKVLFPATDELAENQSELLSQNISFHHQDKTVLVVDDEENVREIAVTLLNELGLKTIEAVDGEEGLAQFQLHQTDIHLVILDLTMPKMGGEACCHAIRELNSEVPIIIASGYSSETISPRFMKEHVSSFIQKPYTPDHFLKTVEEILDV